MNFDLPFSSFALESITGGTHLDEGCTLTIESAGAGHPLLDAGLRGEIVLDASQCAGPASIAVTSTRGQALTITF